MTKNIDRAVLVDIDSVDIDDTLPIQQRIDSFVAQMKTPHCFLCNDTVVTIRFVAENKKMSDALISYFTGLK
ncbi:MAG: hypothetical protein FWE05_01005 [Defluviitaleaceae bacterium]|nr:hypothetical protein [Defluviitaleaceae bacterium]